MNIKLKKKQILLPEMKIFEGDKNCETLNIYADKYYEGLDLSSLDAYVKLSSPYGYDKIEAEKSTEEDKILLSFVFPSAFCAAAGAVEMQISFESEDGEVVLQSDIAVIKIDQSINIGEYIEEYYPDVLTELKGLISQKADADSIPENLSQLVNDVGFVTKDNAVDSISEAEIENLFE